MAYEEADEVRKVRHNGEIKWNGYQIYVSVLLAGEPVGLIRVDEAIAELYFGQLKLGLIFNNVLPMIPVAQYPLTCYV